jgi:hypothetical protein
MTTTTLRRPQRTMVDEYFDYYHSFPFHPELGWVRGAPRCACGQSVEDCGGECEDWALLTLVEPAKAPFPDPQDHS